MKSCKQNQSGDSKLCIYIYIYNVCQTSENHHFILQLFRACGETHSSGMKIKFRLLNEVLTIRGIKVHIYVIMPRK